MTKQHSSNDSWAIAGLLSGRYGKLALTRAAGEAAAAARSGDQARSAVWYSVVNHLRHSLGTMPRAKSPA